MKLSEAFPSQYLRADDLEEGDLTVTIAGAEWRELKDKAKPTPENKPVLLFHEAKPLVLNKTNWKTISDILGSDDTDDWINQQITLTAMQVESFGEMTMAIRVKLQRKPAPQTRPQVQQRPQQAQAFAGAQTPRAALRQNAQVDDQDVPF